MKSELRRAYTSCWRGMVVDGAEKRAEIFEVCGIEDQHKKNLVN